MPVLTDSPDPSAASAMVFEAVQALDVALALWDKDMCLVFGNRLWFQTFFPDDPPEPGANAIELIRGHLARGFYVVPEGMTDAGFLDAMTVHIRDYAKDIPIHLTGGQVLNASVHNTGMGGFLISFRDISDQVRSAAETNRQRAKTERANVRLRDALESIGEAFALFDKNDNLILANDMYKQANPAAAHLMTFGRPRKDIIAAMSTGGDILWVDDWIESYQREAAAGDTSSPRRYEVHHADGRVFMASRGRTAEGGCTITWLDITDTKKTQARARAMANDAIEALDEGFALFNQNMRFQFCNAKFLDVMLGAPVKAPEIGDAAQDIFGAAFDRGLYAMPDPVTRIDFVRMIEGAAGTFAKEIEIRRTDDRVIEASCHQTGLAGYLITARDITEQLAMKAELERQREAAHQNEKLSAMGELLAGVAHELNNPLSIVVGYSMMLQSNVDDPKLRRQVDNIAQAAERCSRIVKAFLAMARQKPAELKRCSLNELVLAALDIVGARLRGAGVQVTLDLDANLPDVDADEDQIIQVLTNLIVNAEQALAERPAAGQSSPDQTTTDTPHHLHLRSFLDKRAGKAVVRVADNGPGIAPDVLKRIFEPFYTTKDVGTGTGIGLAFCHRVVAAHGGRMTVRSKPGHGARFYVRLCLAEGTEAQDTPVDQPGTAEDAHVLVVDDEEGVATLIGDVLTDAGYRVTLRNDAQAALDLADTCRFDAVLSDIKMPGMDGPAFFRALCDRNAALARRTAFITGDTLSKDVATFLFDIEQPHLEKPVTPAELLALVAELIAKAEG